MSVDLAHQALDAGFGLHEFGLSASDEARAAELHRDTLIIDMCLQGPCGYRSFTPAMEKELREAWERDADPWQAFTEAWLLPIRLALQGESTELRDCWLASGVTGGNREVILDHVDAPIEASLAWTANAIAQFDRLPWMIKALNAGDFERAKRNGQPAGYMNSQFSSGLQTVEHVSAAHDLGVRMIQLTYNRANHLGSGCTEEHDGGLTRLGQAFAEKMNDLGIIVDTAHCGRQTTLDACKHTCAPLVASHTSAGRLFPCARAKTDAEFEAIAATGGVIGIYAVPFFLTDARDASIEAMLDHIDYVSKTVGSEHVGIGTDWPLQLSRWTLENVLTPWVGEIGFRAEHGIDPLRNLVGFDDFRDFPNITRGLVSRGYSDDDIRGIIGGNFLRVFRSVCG